MKTIIAIQLAVMTNLICLSNPSWSSGQLNPDTKNIANKWADITYLNNTNSKKRNLAVLKSQAESLLLTNPDNENLLTWTGIITASYAGEVAGLKALRNVKKAKIYLEKAMEINPDALNGGARTSLGALYYQVPGWPLAFGNLKKAESLLAESVDRFPDDINTLYFMADFLISQERNEEAIIYLQKASNQKPRNDFQVADTGRLREIDKALMRLQQ